MRRTYDWAPPNVTNPTNRPICPLKVQRSPNGYAYIAIGALLQCANPQLSRRYYNCRFGGLLILLLVRRPRRPFFRGAMIPFSSIRPPGAVPR